MVWSPIADIAPNEIAFADPAVPALAAAMHERVQELRVEKELETYLEKLRRSWAIETGILERLYEVSDAATKTLLEHGLDSAYLVSGDTGSRDPHDVLDILRDQKATIDGLYAFVADGGELTKSFVRQLHQQMTAHQQTYEAESRVGDQVLRIQMPMEHGTWKKQQNSVGLVEVCPVDQVDPEMERLIKLDAEHVSDKVPAVVQAAWIHHRFLLIHPFADGNGRIARCLATLVLLRDRMMPLVIERGARGTYIENLRKADFEDLKSFISMVEGIQRREIQRAMEVAAEMRQERRNITDRIAGLGSKLQRRAALARGEREAVHAMAGQGFEVVAELLEQAKAQLDKAIAGTDPAFHTWTRGAHVDTPEASYNWFQVTRCAKVLDYYANSKVFRAWYYLGVRIGGHHEILFSFHGMGPGQTDVLACSAMRYERYQREDGMALGEIHPLVEYPFTFTTNERPQDAADRFRAWATAALDAGLEQVERLL